MIVSITFATSFIAIAVGLVCFFYNNFVLIGKNIITLMIIVDALVMLGIAIVAFFDRTEIINVEYKKQDKITNIAILSVLVLVFIATSLSLKYSIVFTAYNISSISIICIVVGVIFSLIGCACENIHRRSIKIVPILLMILFLTIEFLEL